MSNNRRKKRSKTKNSLQSTLMALKAFAATSAILVLSALGLWRCLDANDTDLGRLPQKRVSVDTVDVGKGKKADPTLVNESQLLKEEKLEPELDTAPPEEEDAPTPVEKEEDAPKEDRFPLFGVAFHFHTQIKSAPEADARAIAYARRGATFRLSESLSTAGCSAGWHEIAPGSLFVCKGEGVIIDKRPVTFTPSPPEPNLDSTMPYRYAWATQNNTPEYWRIPTTDEIKTVDRIFEQLSAREPSTDEQPKEISSAAPATTSEETSTAEEGSSTAAPAVSDTDTLPNDTQHSLDAPSLELPNYVHLRMAKGYYVSTDDVVAEEGVEYQRTVRGRFIPRANLAPVTPPDFQGILLGSVKRLPRVFVAGGGVKMLRQSTPGGPLLNDDPVTRLSDLHYLGEMTRRNRTYVQVDEDLFLSSRVAAVAKTAEPPKDLQPEERWIDIDLSEQTLVAYEGERAVFATLVSTGRETFETPTGSFRIYGKHITITMDDTEAGEEAYSIEDVPWVQYFEESFALHAAFWHNRFGRVRSHGCVNLSPSDAKRLFYWTGPVVPDGVHGILANKENRGTRIIIHD